jgi:hypothetical protein
VPSPSYCNRALKAQCKRLQQAIAEHFATHEYLLTDLQRLQTIPAVGPKIPMRMLVLLTLTRPLLLSQVV